MPYTTAGKIVFFDDGAIDQLICTAQSERIAAAIARTLNYAAERQQSRNQVSEPVKLTPDMLDAPVFSDMRDDAARFRKLCDHYSRGPNAYVYLHDERFYIGNTSPVGGAICQGSTLAQAIDNLP